MIDLQLAFEVLKAKNAAYTKLWRYYDGNQPLKYSTERLREAFRSIDVRFSENWCAVAVDAVLDRLTLRELNAPGIANDVLDAVWYRNQLKTDAYDAHQGACITGEAYLIAWPDEDDNLDVYYNDARMVHLFYDPSNPKRKRFAAKMWRENDVWRMTLYYPDRLEQYASRSTKESLDSHTGFGNPLVEDNTEGIIPVFHIRASRRKATSQLDNIIPLQDAINKLLADMMVSAEFGAFKQRYIISNSDTSGLKNKPGTIFDIPAGMAGEQPTQVGEFTETNLLTYMDTIDRLVNAVAVISKTPKHYFLQGGTSGISGDALIALEAPLVTKTERMQEAFAMAWQELGQYICQRANIPVSAGDIQAVWSPAKSVQPTSEAAALQSSVGAKMPLVTAVRRQGWTEADIQQMLMDQKEEQERDMSMSKVLLDAARKRADQTNADGSNG